MNSHEPVLVVGAGPSGLAATASLLRAGVSVRTIDAAEKPSPLTKALMVWPRTLEVIDSLTASGDKASATGQTVQAFRYNADGREICRLDFDDQTRPRVITQPDVERLLADSVASNGGEIERGTTLTALDQDAEGVTATVTGPEGMTETIRCSYVIGADGAGSAVRRLIGASFTGDTYPHTFVLADVGVVSDLQRDAVHYYCSPNGIMVIVPLYNGRFRLFTAGPPGLKSEDLDIAMLQSFVDHRGPKGLTLVDSSWQTTFSIHARHADRFSSGRVFLVGDAAHIHSPAGGQGLNTGVTDAHNLAWKLAAVLDGAPTALLDTYESERRVIAAAVVRQAESQTKAWMLSEPWQRVLRDAAAWVAERTGLFARYYNPWLAGLTSSYPSSIAIRRNEGSGPIPLAGIKSRPEVGFLVPNPTIYDGDVMSTTALRSALSATKITILVAESIDPPDIDRLVDQYGERVDVRVLTRGGTLVTYGGADTRATAAERHVQRPPNWFRNGSDAFVIRPDHYVAHVGTGTQAREFLETLLGDRASGQIPASTEAVSA